MPRVYVLLFVVELWVYLGVDLSTRVDLGIDLGETCHNHHLKNLGIISKRWALVRLGEPIRVKLWGLKLY